jgi:ribosomal-protein-alanine N-acetyltransferase
MLRRCSRSTPTPRRIASIPAEIARTREEAAARLAGWQREWRELGFGFWAVSVPPDPQVIGFGGVTRQIFHERLVLNAYYRFDPSAWGHGYATEMAAIAAALACRLLPEWPMIVRTRPGNRAAQAARRNSASCAPSTSMITC